MNVLTYRLNSFGWIDFDKWGVIRKSIKNGIKIDMWDVGPTIGDRVTDPKSLKKRRVEQVHFGVENSKMEIIVHSTRLDETKISSISWFWAKINRFKMVNLNLWGVGKTPRFARFKFTISNSDTFWFEWKNSCRTPHIWLL